MQNLFNFLIKNSPWFIFILLQIICFYFIFHSNSYQKSIFLNSSNIVTGNVYKLTGLVTSYFGLRQENDVLLEKNADLQIEVLELREKLLELESDSLKTQAFLQELSNVNDNYKFIKARVIENSIANIRNTITIDKGRSDGVEMDMGVVSQTGIVGVVRAVSDHFAVIQSLLNPDSKFNCKILNSNTQGTLMWDGKDPQFGSLIDFPKYGKFEVGDSIVTSGISEFFPEGIFVGTVEEYKSETDDNFYILKIKLSTNFSSLKNILLFKNSKVEELNDLKNQLDNAKK